MFAGCLARAGHVTTVGAVGSQPFCSRPGRKTMIKRSIGLFAILSVLFFWPCLSEAGGFKMTSRSAILMDMNTGRILYSHFADTRLQPASITKSSPFTSPTRR